MEKMKKCPKCGAIQSLSRTSCIDCGTFLGEAHSEFAKELDENAKDTLERKLDYDDTSSPLYYIKRVIFIVTAFMFIADIVLFVMFKGKNNTALVTVSIIASILSLLITVFPRQASVVFRSRRFYRAPMTSREADYIDSGERIAMIIVSAVFLVIAVGSSACFLYERPTVEPERITFETMEDKSARIIEIVG